MPSEKQYMASSAFGYVNFNYNEEGYNLSQGDVEAQYGKTLSELNATQRYGNLNKESMEKLPEFDKEKVFQSIDNWKLLNYQNKNDTTGFCASAYETPEGQVVFAFRGTEPTVNDHSAIPEDIKPDVMIGLSQDFTKNLPPQFEEAKTFIKTTLGQKYHFNPDTVTDKELKECVAANQVTSTGHSLGGGESQYFTYLTGGRSVTFNGVGIGQNFRLTPEEAERFNAVNIANQNDVVGNTGLHLGQQRSLEGHIYPTSMQELFGMLTTDHGIHTMLDSFDNGDNLTQHVSSNQDSFVQKLSETARPYLAATGEILQSYGIIHGAQGIDYLHDGYLTDKKALTNFEEAKDKVIKTNMEITKTNVDAIVDSRTIDLKQEQAKMVSHAEAGKAVIKAGIGEVAAVLETNSPQIGTGVQAVAAGSGDLAYGVDVTGAILNTARKIGTGDSLSQAASSEGQERWDHIKQGASQVSAGLTDIKDGVVNDLDGIKTVSIQEANKIAPILSDLYGDAKGMCNTVGQGLHEIQTAVTIAQDNTDREIQTLRDVRNEKLSEGFQDLEEGALHIAKGVILNSIPGMTGVDIEPAKNDPVADWNMKYDNMLQDITNSYGNDREIAEKINYYNETGQLAAFSKSGLAVNDKLQGLLTERYNNITKDIANGVTTAEVERRINYYEKNGELAAFTASGFTVDNDLTFIRNNAQVNDVAQVANWNAKYDNMMQDISNSYGNDREIAEKINYYNETGQLAAFRESGLPVNEKLNELLKDRYDNVTTDIANGVRRGEIEGRINYYERNGELKAFMAAGFSVDNDLSFIRNNAQADIQFFVNNNRQDSSQQYEDGNSNQTPSMNYSEKFDQLLAIGDGVKKEFGLGLENMKQAVIRYSGIGQ